MPNTTKLKSLLKALKTISLTELLLKAIELNEEFIVYLNTEQLRDKGITNTGQSISSYAPYSDYTILKKTENNTLTNNNSSIVNLRETRDFHLEFYLEVKGDQIMFWSGDDKTDKLVEKYGTQIFGLTKQSIKIANEEVLLPKMRQWINEKIRDAVK